MQAGNTVGGGLRTFSTRLSSSLRGGRPSIPTLTRLHPPALFILSNIFCSFSYFAFTGISSMKTLPVIPSITVFSLCTLLLVASVPTVKPESNLRKQKVTQFKLFWHDVVGGENPTAVSVVPPANNASSRGNAFGMVRIMDNALTAGPRLSSKLLGRAQGFYAMTSQQEVAMLVGMNMVFTEGKYNGSTITVMGWNPVLRETREMPVVGGTGYFRFARGFVRLKTRKFDLKSLDATVEYKIYVLHY